MAQNYRKSIANVGLSIGGVNISEGGGENEFVTVTPPERGGGKAGVHGDTALWDIPGGVYEVQITLLESAEANRNLQNIFNEQIDRTTEGSLDFSLEDTGTGETFSGQCIFKKEPDRAKAAEEGNYQWDLLVSSQTGWTYSDRTVIVP
jgi:hypothetical protein